jgi:hypothetical protein
MESSPILFITNEVRMIEYQSFSKGLTRHIKVIDEMVERVNHFKVIPEFTQQVEERRNLIPNFSWKDEEILRRLILVIAYSNQANAQNVTQIVKRGVFNTIFHDYCIDTTAKLSAEDIKHSYWQTIKPIRFKYKVDAMVRCASCLLAIRGRYGSFMRFVSSTRLPSFIKSESDFRDFWEGFTQIRAYFSELHFPYISNFTSLCHFLMDLGFDCAKPDDKVMEAAVVLPQLEMEEAFVR